MLYLGEAAGQVVCFGRNVGDEMLGRNVVTKRRLPVAALDVEAGVPVEPPEVPHDVILQRRLLVLGLPGMVKWLKWLKWLKWCKWYNTSVQLASELGESNKIF